MTIDLPLTPDDVNEIATILDGSHFDRLDLKTARFRLRVARDGTGWTQNWSLEDEATPAAPAMAPMAGAAGDADLPEGHAAIPAPLPGTFYRAPQPGAPPFVQPGDAVTPDTVVGIVETMKLMNPVHAGCTGVVAAILVDNATMVDGGVALMHVKTA
ncbi:MAG: acetyl-CoA carboxylase biotin carboxyl carrier protein [Chakrabartia sp.]